MKYYKSALDKIKLSEAEKDKAKALFHQADKEREINMKVKRLFKPAVAIAASLAIVLSADTVIPMVQGVFGNTSDQQSSNEVSNNYFAVKAYAKKLSKTEKVFSNEYTSLGSAICGGENGEISFAFDFPVECEGKNVDTITYTIKEGAFQITTSSQKKQSIVISGDKLEEELNVPGNIKGDEEEVQCEQYKSFTVEYDNQMNDKTNIDIVDTSDTWSEEKQSQYKKLNYSIVGSSLEETKEARDFFAKDLGIACTVTYKDGSTETKNIVVSNEIVDGSEVNAEGKVVVTCFSIQ